MALADIQAVVDALVRDDTGKITSVDRDEAIGLAAERYSSDRPRALVEDLTADGTNLLALPVAWESDFSVLSSLEYPIGDAPPTLIDDGDFGLYVSPAAIKIMLVSALPIGDAIRASYTVRHQLTDATDTIPAGDREVVSAYAAAHLLDQLAALFSGDSDTTIAADDVDHGGKGERFASRARSLRKRYFETLGIDPKRNVATGVVVDLDRADSRGRDRLTHPGRYR